MSTGTKSYQFKVVLLGEGCVGKTSLMLRYIENKFNDKHLSTIQAAFMKKKIMIGNNCVELAIWDTAGQERYHALSPIYYRGSNGAFLVYDITDQDSFERIKIWVKELKKVLGDDVVLCIVGNKSDLEQNRRITQQEATEYAASVGAEHYSTSAKLNRGVNELFFEISKKMIEKFDKDDKNSDKQKQRTLIRVDDDTTTDANEKKGGCC